MDSGVPGTGGAGCLKTSLSSAKMPVGGGKSWDDHLIPPVTRTGLEFRNAAEAFHNDTPLLNHTLANMFKSNNNIPHLQLNSDGARISGLAQQPPKRKRKLRADLKKTRLWPEQENFEHYRNTGTPSQLHPRPASPFAFPSPNKQAKTQMI